MSAHGVCGTTAVLHLTSPETDALNLSDFQRSCKTFLIVHIINIIMLSRIGKRSHFNPEGQGSL